jgi:hypothetical protein
MVMHEPGGLSLFLEDGALLNIGQELDWLNRQDKIKAVHETLINTAKLIVRSTRDAQHVEWPAVFLIPMSRFPRFTWLGGATRSEQMVTIIFSMLEPCGSPEVYELRIR